MTNIVPIIFPLIGTATKLDVIITSFNSSATTCTTSNTLLDDDGNILLSWFYNLTEAQYSNWGSDNSYIIQCVANDKGIVIL